MIGQRVVLRPRTILEIGDLTSVFVRAHLGYFARGLPWVLVPGVLGLVASVWLDSHWPLVVGWFAASVGGSWFTLLCGMLLLQPPEPGLVSSRFFSAWRPLVLARLVGWLRSVPPICLATCAGGIFLPEAVGLEHNGLRAAVRRSGGLVTVVPARWMGLAGALLLVSAVGAATAAVAWSYLSGVVALSERWTDWEVYLRVAYVGVVLVLPYQAAFRFLTYVDCRTRREGWDLQVQMAVLAAEEERRVGAIGRNREAA